MKKPTLNLRLTLLLCWSVAAFSPISATAGPFLTFDSKGEVGLKTPLDPAPETAATTEPSPCLPAPSGLTAWYPADGDGSDIRGSNSGALKNGATFAVGKVGQAFSLDGVDDYVEIPHSRANNPPLISVAAWVRPDSVNAGSRIISKDSSATTCTPPTVNYSLEIRGLQGNRADFFFTTGDGAFHELVGTSVIPTGVFTHIAATYDGTTAKIYVNGVLENSFPVTGSSLAKSTAPVIIGGGGAGCRASHGGLIEFKGLIDEVQIYKRALTDSEISGIVNAGSAGTCNLTPGLWVAGLDLAFNEKPDRATEVNAQNSVAPEWSYGYRSVAASTALTLFTPQQHVNDASGIEGWIAPGQATLAVNTKDTPIVFNTGSGNYKPLLAKQIYLSPGSGNEFLVVRWTAPAAGDYRALGRWVDLDNHGGNGAIAYLIVNGQQSVTCTDGKDCSFVDTFETQPSKKLGRARMRSRTLSLNAGDTIDFVLGSNGDNTFDATAFNAAVCRVPKVNITAPATYVEGQEIAVDVDVKHGAPITGVRLFVDGHRHDHKVTPPYHFVLKPGRGTHYLRASAYDDRETLGTSTSVRVRPAETAATTPGTNSADSPDSAAAVGKTYYCQTSGFWNEASTWGSKGAPGINDSVVIGNAFTVILTGETEVQNLESAGRIEAAGAPFTIASMLRVYGICSLAGELQGPMDFILPQGAKFYTPTGSLSLKDVTFYNNGDLIVEGTAIVSERSVLKNSGGMTIVAPPGTQNQVNVQIDKVELNGGSTVGGPNTVLNTGGVLVAGGTYQAAPGYSPLVGPDGNTLVGLDSNSLVSPDGSSLVSPDGGSLVSPDGSSLVGNDGNSLIGPDGLRLVGNDGNSLIANARNTSASNSADSGNAPAAGGILLTGGTITGTGEFVGDVVNQGAFITPGNSAGGLVVNGNYTQGSGATLVLELGGNTLLNDFTYDVFQVAGTANLGGNLVVKTINGYTPAPGETTPALLYGSHTGNFDSVTSNTQVTLGATGADITTNGTNPPLPKALNISTRLQIQSGDNALFAGFIVTGPSGSTKKVLIRGIGPSLAQFGVPGTIPDPLLELHTGSETITNDNWQQAPNANEIPNGFAPSDPKESAIVATLAPGSYSAVLKGAHGETGVGLAEVYDLEPNSGAQLANIATRGFVQTGDSVLIGGFIVAGNQPAKMLVRAIGPSLSAFLPGALQDTVLEVHDANGGVISNDNWRDTDEAAIQATTIPPSHDNEAAVLAILAPGSYTAIVRGADDTTGIAVVEAYNLSE